MNWLEKHTRKIHGLLLLTFVVMNASIIFNLVAGPVQ